MARASQPLVQITLSPALRGKDAKLLRLVDSAFARVARKSGAWLVCRPGCTPCCHGPFAISQLDAARLRDALAALAKSNPEKAAAIRARAQQSAKRLTGGKGKHAFPGDPRTGLLSDDEDSVDRFMDANEDEPCPVLSDSHAKDGAGRCELYAARPMTCRVFGPPIRSAHMSTEVSDQGDGAAGATALGHCELCYHGATPEEVAACELDPGPTADALEQQLTTTAERQAGTSARTLVAFALR